LCSAVFLGCRAFYHLTASSNGVVFLQDSDTRDTGLTAAKEVDAARSR